MGGAGKGAGRESAVGEVRSEERWLGGSYRGGGAGRTTQRGRGEGPLVGVVRDGVHCVGHVHRMWVVLVLHVVVVGGVYSARRAMVGGRVVRCRWRSRMLCSSCWCVESSVQLNSRKSGIYMG